MATRRGKRWIIGGIIAVAVLALVGWTAYDRLLRRDVPQHADLAEHFKYGSIGNEAELGLPYPIWSVLPEVCAHHLPTGGGYAAFGFQYEDGRDVPVGMSKVRIGFERIAINCAVCHVTPVRFSPDEAPTLLLAGTSPTFDIQAYQRFLAACAADPAFSPATLLPVIEQRFDLDAIDGLLYRYLIIPMTRDGIHQQAEEFAWTHDNPRWGPGRIDPFNPVKFGMLGLPVDAAQQVQFDAVDLRYRLQRLPLRLPDERVGAGRLQPARGRRAHALQRLGDAGQQGQLRVGVTRHGGSVWKEVVQAGGRTLAGAG